MQGKSDIQNSNIKSSFEVKKQNIDILFWTPTHGPFHESSINGVEV